MAENVPHVERRVLLVPPTERDAAAMCTVLGEHGIPCVRFGSMADMASALKQGAAAAVVSEEALAADPAALFACLSGQPVWSDVPIIVLSRSGSESPTLSGLLGTSGNVSVLERPVRVSTFLSVVRVALRGRERQYQVREHLQRLEAVEAQRRSLWESERSARAEAERAGRMKDEFLATLSHEIRTPLNAILGWTHLLGMPQRTAEDVEKGLAVIERNAKAQAQIVADLLDMNRIVNGKVRLDVQQLSLASVVQAAAETFLPAAEAKGVRLEAIMDPSPTPVCGDPGRLQQVFWNLLSNAVKFTPKGEHVQIVLARVNANVEVRVADTGEGIAPEFLPHVFDRFRQADGSTTRRHGGLGLGLAIVKQLVELHGGAIRAKSLGVGKGSTFIVTLPLSTAPSESLPSPPSARAPTINGRAEQDPLSNITGLRVLVVDDERDARELVQRLLEGGGALVTTAPSAREGLAAVHRDRPDLVISDIGMPEEDGYSFMRKLRALAVQDGGQIVAIALTAYARSEDRVNSIRAGFQYHVSKPVDPAEFLAIVSNAARRSMALRSAARRV